MQIPESLYEAIRNANREQAMSLILEWAGKAGYDRLFPDLLEPVLLKIGEEWRTQGSFSLAQAYIASKIAEDAILEIARHKQAGSVPPPSRGNVVLGNIEDDFHALGRKIVATFLRLEGLNVIDLGNDVPSSVFVDTAVAHQAKVIGVSAMMLSTARNIRHLRSELEQRGLAGKIRLAVGGAVFLVMPELVSEVGGDGTAPNALAASALVDRLWQESLVAEEGP
jgi:methanogenic corrinoid protein MtbC1